ncbi:hypothetical protein [Leptospira wolffii]|uniref:hypothetical protein n=1 Tax=Leptospira wolffii TaxID=409998 RepID=UPI00058F10DF|nr:hypothetical protein [Leptospira wolffii]
MKDRCGLWIFICILLHTVPILLQVTDSGAGVADSSSLVQTTFFTFIFYGVILDLSDISVFTYLGVRMIKGQGRIQGFGLLHWFLFALLVFCNLLWYQRGWPVSWIVEFLRR